MAFGLVYTCTKVVLLDSDLMYESFLELTSTGVSCSKKQRLVKNSPDGIHYNMSNALSYRLCPSTFDDESTHIMKNEKNVYCNQRMCYLVYK